MKIVNINNIEGVKRAVHTKYITFTQKEKKTLLQANYPNVNTIHEIQVQTFRNVNLVRQLVYTSYPYL